MKKFIMKAVIASALVVALSSCGLNAQGQVDEYVNQILSSVNEQIKQNQNNTQSQDTQSTFSTDTTSSQPTTDTTQSQAPTDTTQNQITTNTQPTQPVQQTQSQNTSSYIGDVKAKSIALQHAGLTESQISSLRCKLDYDHGRAEYEVEFHANYLEYEYTIDATTGAILKYEQDR